MRARIAAWMFSLALTASASGAPAPSVPVDHHQHLLSPAMVRNGEQPITAAQLVAALDAAGIKRAVILSNAYRVVPDEYQRVIAENDWTAREAAKYPKRLVAFCGVNPLKDYALGELARCARDPRFGRGIKLQFGNSGVDLEDPVDLAMLRRVFRAANAAGLAIVAHVVPSQERARIFLDELLPAAPDVVVQIAHLGGGGGGAFEPAAEQSLDVFASAFARKDPRVSRLYFDVAGITGGADAATRAARIAQLLRLIGTKHLLYGSDGGDPTDPPPKDALAAFRKLPLMPVELRAIEGNVAPYLRTP